MGGVGLPTFPGGTKSRMPQPGWLDVAGGKLTTYRRIAQQAVDRIVGHLGRKVEPCRTADEPLLEPSEVAPTSGVLPPPVGRDIVVHACENEWAVHLDDILLRRTGWHYYLPESDAVAEQTADWMAQHLGWDTAARAAELARYRRAVGLEEH